jgi:hypothetical protein
MRGARVHLVDLTDSMGIPRDAFQQLKAFRRAHGQHFCVNQAMQDVGVRKTPWDRQLVEIYCTLSLIGMDPADFYRGLPPCPDVFEFCPKNLSKKLYRTMTNFVPPVEPS